eukprot:6725761-Prorocentrum_lima.AAC.1
MDGWARADENASAKVCCLCDLACQQKGWPSFRVGNQIHLVLDEVQRRAQGLAETIVNLLNRNGERFFSILAAASKIVSDNNGDFMDILTDNIRIYNVCRAKTGVNDVGHHCNCGLAFPAKMWKKS